PAQRRRRARRLGVEAARPRAPPDSPDPPRRRARRPRRAPPPRPLRPPRLRPRDAGGVAAQGRRRTRPPQPLPGHGGGDRAVLPQWARGGGDLRDRRAAGGDGAPDPPRLAALGPGGDRRGGGPGSRRRPPRPRRPLAYRRARRQPLRAVRLRRPRGRARAAPGVEGNRRLTSLTGAVQLAVLAVVILSGLVFGSAPGLHFFSGFLAIPLTVVKLGSTGWRFAAYYLRRTPAYRGAGPPTVIP